MVFSKSGEFKQVAKAFDLAGHSSGILDFTFSADSSSMATVSKDGTYRLYDTKSNKLYNDIFAIYFLEFCYIYIDHYIC